MSKDNKHIANTSFEEYKKYLEGKLSPSEQHAFEKKMLNDDFEADALSGFEKQEISLISQDISELNQRLSPQKEKSGINYMKLAAVIAFFLSFTVALFFIIRPEADKNLSDQNPAETLNEDTPEETAQDLMDSIESLESLDQDQEAASDIPQQLSVAEAPVQPKPIPNESLALREEKILDISDEEMSEIIEELQRESVAINRVKSKEYEQVDEIILEPIPETGRLERVRTSTLEPTDDMTRDNETLLPGKLEYDEGMKERPGAVQYVNENNITSRSKKAKEPMAEVAKVQGIDMAEEIRTKPIPDQGNINFYKYINENLQGKKWPAIVNAKIKLNESGEVIEVEIASDMNESKKSLISQLLLDGPKWIFEGEEKTLPDTFYQIEIPVNPEFR